MDDGTVKVICEGDKKAIEEFARKIKIKQYPINVKDVDVDYSNATGEFNSFEIIWEDDITRARFERMATAARYLRETKSDLKNEIRSGNEMLGGKIDGLGGEMDNAAMETRNGFAKNG